VTATSRTPTHKPPSVSDALVVDAISGGYRGVQVIWDVSLALKSGKITALVGSNGAGKSTLLKTLSGLLTPTLGKISLNGQDITRLKPHTIARLGLSHVAEGRRIFRSESVEANLDIGLYDTSADATDRKRRFDHMYTLFPVLAEKRIVRAGLLSGGQQQMLAIAQAFISDPRVVMLDEPSLGLAPSVIDQVFDALQMLKTASTTILLVEQMVELALDFADIAYVMQSGRIIGFGPSADIRGGELLKRAYMLG
jgi:branched-chain amino acid transport system ATP-binding protein